ncbi:uncharacterized protein LOC107857854 [Capsicum annuum]|uniref:uncharacterized protein LOC107857854 n=1 Tax=Capsicum annuum TaxID=4072 RepID=UPI001FB06B32|nr:uncharacterized protein LOC107857854 [Capsicum annuum]
MKANNTKFGKFMAMFNKLIINLPLVEVLEQMPRYAIFMKDLVTKKRTVSYDMVDNLHYCVSISIRLLVLKKENPGAFTIPCTIRPLKFAKSLCDLGASINLMPPVVYKKLDLGDPSSTDMRLFMAERSVKWPTEILYDVLVKVASFICPADFVILDYEGDFEVPIILGSLFLATGNVLIDLRANKLLFRLNDEVVQFDVCQSIKQYKDMGVFSIVDVYYKEEQEVPIEENFAVDTLAFVLMNFDQDGIEYYEEIVCALKGMGSYSYAPKKLDLDLKNYLSPPAKLFIEEPPTLELKSCPII